MTVSLRDCGRCCITVCVRSRPMYVCIFLPSPTPRASVSVVSPVSVSITQCLVVHSTVSVLASVSAHTCLAVALASPPSPIRVRLSMPVCVFEFRPVITLLYHRCPGSRTLACGAVLAVPSRHVPAALGNFAAELGCSDLSCTYRCDCVDACVGTRMCAGAVRCVPCGGWCSCGSGRLGVSWCTVMCWWLCGRSPQSVQLFFYVLLLFFVRTF